MEVEFKLFLIDVQISSIAIEEVALFKPVELGLFFTK